MRLATQIQVSREAFVKAAEWRAAARVGVMAVVILPLLPEGPIGPFGGVRHRDLW